MSENNYVSNMLWWYEKLGRAKFVTFMCDGVASRLGEKVFDDLLGIG